MNKFLNKFTLKYKNKKKKQIEEDKWIKKINKLMDTFMVIGGYIVNNYQKLTIIKS